MPVTSPRRALSPDFFSDETPLVPVSIPSARAAHKLSPGTSSLVRDTAQLFTHPSKLSLSISISPSNLVRIFLCSPAFHVSDDDIVNKSIVSHSPYAFGVLNISQHGNVWLQLNGRVSFDAAIIIVKPDNDDCLMLGAWKAIGRRSIRNLGTVSMSLSSTNITSQLYDPVSLLTAVTPPFQIPLTVNTLEAISWLTPSLSRPHTSFQ